MWANPNVHPVLVDSDRDERNVAIGIVNLAAERTIAFVALRSPRRGRVARRSPSIAIVRRRLLGRFLLGEGDRAAVGAATSPFVA
jgi:ABC-type enterobactin transport system permease subunit